MASKLEGMCTPGKNKHRAVSSKFFIDHLKFPIFTPLCKHIVTCGVMIGSITVLPHCACQTLKK